MVDRSDAEVLAGGEGYETFGLATVGRLRGLGYEVVATDVFDDGVPVPFSERHVDVLSADTRRVMVSTSRNWRKRPARRSVSNSYRSTRRH